MSRIFLSFILFTLSLQAQARLMANISMVYKNGIDKNLVLESELHSIEELWGKRRIRLIMKNGAQLKLRAGFWERPIAKLETVGPSSKIFIEGQLLMPSGKVVKRVERRQTQVDIGEEFTMDFQDQTQLLRVTIRPFVE